MSPGLSTFEIREMRAADVEAVIDLTEALNEAPRWATGVYAALISPGSPRERIALVAQDSKSGAVAGLIVARLIAPEAELESIAVARAMQRRGAGRQLLERLRERLREEDLESLHLEVRVSNRAAICLYKTFGFNETARRPRYYTDPVEDAVLMTCRLR